MSPSFADQNPERNSMSRVGRFSGVGFTLFWGQPVAEFNGAGVKVEELRVLSSKCEVEGNRASALLRRFPGSFS